jgi:tripartite-type tricarboxylate transporter receptor subunit TctC
MKSRLITLAAALVAFIALVSMNPVPARAEVPKCISIRLIVPQAVGTATDMVMRAFAETINRRGSGPLLKVINATKTSVTWQGIWAKPDGCNLLATTQSLVADHLVNKRKPKWSRFKPIAMLARTPLLVVARRGLKDATLANIVEKALQDSNTIGIGETPGALARMLVMSLEDAAGARFRIMTYDTGRQSYSALLAGKLDIGIVSATGAKRRVDQKELQALAVTTEERSILLPAVPTMMEEGIPGAFSIDRGLLAPKETPDEIVSEIAGWFEKASEVPELVDRLAEHGSVTSFMGSDDYKRYFENLTADWQEMMQRAVGKQIRKKSG